LLIPVTDAGEASVVGGRKDGDRAAPGDAQEFTWRSEHTIALLLLCVAQVLDGIDVTVVNVALPAIEDELGFSAGTLSWVVNAYMVMFGGFLLLGGRAGDLVGRRRIFLVGLALFVAASLASGLAQDPAALVAARAAQGLAAALIAPMTLALIAVTFPEGAARNRAFAIWGGAYGISSALGLLIGGLLVSGPGWRWIFLVNVPIGVIVLIAALWYLPADRPARRHRRFDVGGAATSTAGVGLLCYAVLQAGVEGWGTGRTISLLAGAVVLLGYFVLHETRVAAEPLVAFSLFRNRSLAGANLVTVVRGAAMFALFYFATLYLQEVLHQSALTTGLAYLPLTVVLLIASAAGPALVRRLGIRVVLFGGSLVAAAGLALFTGISPDGTLLGSVIAPSVVVGLGFAIMVVPTTIAALTGVAASHAGVASALLNVSLQVGGALGVAVLSAVATVRTSDRLRGGHGAEAALIDGFVLAFVLASVLMVLTAVLTIILFREQGRGDRVDVMELQRAGLDT
jgi:EmrB/QacA subfamily drug resistance transporter